MTELMCTVCRGFRIYREQEKIDVINHMLVTWWHCLECLHHWVTQKPYDLPENLDLPVGETIVDPLPLITVAGQMKLFE